MNLGSPVTRAQRNPSASSLLLPPDTSRCSSRTSPRRQYLSSFVDTSGDSRTALIRPDNPVNVITSSDDEDDDRSTHIDPGSQSPTPTPTQPKPTNRMPKDKPTNKKRKQTTSVPKNNKKSRARAPAVKVSFSQSIHSIIHANVFDSELRAS